MIANRSLASPSPRGPRPRLGIAVRSPVADLLAGHVFLSRVLERRVSDAAIGQAEALSKLTGVMSRAGHPSIGRPVVGSVERSRDSRLSLLTDGALLAQWASRPRQVVVPDAEAGRGMNPELVSIVSWGAQLVIGASLLQAGIAKLRDLDSAASAVSEYRLLPTRIVYPAAVLIMTSELIAGAGLLAGVRESYVPALGLLSAFALAVATVLARGLEIDCHCGGPRERVTTRLIRGDVTLSDPWTIINISMWRSRRSMLMWSGTDAHVAAVHSVLGRVHEIWSADWRLRHQSQSAVEWKGRVPLPVRIDRRPLE